MKIVMIAGLSALAIASNASAQEWYGQLNAGMGVGGKADADFSVTVDDETYTASEDNDLDGGWLVSGAIGRDSGAFRWDVEVVYSTNDLDDIVLTDGTEELEITGLAVSQASGLVNAYYDFNTEGAWQPYVGAGVGYGATRFKADEEDEVDSGLTWQLKAGVNIVASETLSWDIGYRYLRFADFETADDEEGFETSLAVDTNLHALTVGMRFSF